MKKIIKYLLLIILLVGGFVVESCTNTGSLDKSVQIPKESLKKIEITEGQLTNQGSIVFSLYNGSEWEVREVVIRIAAFKKGVGQQWDRKFKEDIWISSLKSDRFLIKWGTKTDFDEAIWEITSAKGYKN